MLALAIPLQGFAAATMLSCGPEHHRMMAAKMAGDAAVHHHAAQGHAAAAASFADEAAAPAHLVTAVAAAADAPALEDLHQLANFKCSACAACGVTTALPSSSVAFEPLEQTAVFVLPPTAAGPPFLTGGLERPPRLLLA